TVRFARRTDLKSVPPNSRTDSKSVPPNRTDSKSVPPNSRTDSKSVPPNGETQKDSFTINVLPRPPAPTRGAKIALLDPKGETAKVLTGLNVRFRRVDAATDLSGYDVLIVGKEALTSGGRGPDVGRVRDGLKVVVFEQTAKVLEERFGFRVAEYGLRQVFRRVPDHPLLAGLGADHLRDWRGEATLLPPRLKYTLRPRHGP